MSNASKVKRHRGVDLKLVKTDVLKASLEALDIVMGKGDAATDVEMIDALADHFGKESKKGVELLDCSCGGESPATVDSCPFCGDSELDESAPAPKATPKAKEAKADPEPPKETKTKEAKADPEETETKAEEPTTRRKKVSGEAKAPETQETLPGLGGAPQGKPKPTLVGDSTALAKAPTTQKLTQVIPSTGARKGEIVTTTEADLDRIVAEIEQLKTKGVQHFQSTSHRIGTKIKEAYETNAWKQRTDDKGKPVYKSFDAFALKELGMSHANAWNLMKVAKHFSEEQVANFGTTKLNWVLSAPESEQERLLTEHVAKGATVQEIKAEAKAARAKGGAPKSTTAKTKRTAAAAKANQGHKRTTAAKPGKVQDKITVSKIVGVQNVHLFTEKSWKEPKDQRKPVKASKLSQVPSGTLELPNDVVMHFAIRTLPSGALKLVINTERVKG